MTGSNYLRAGSRILRPILRPLLLSAGPVAALVLGAYLYTSSGRYVTTENAYIKANLVAISADVSGRAIEVAVDDHARVNKGDLLFRLDPAPFEFVLAEASARIVTVRNDIASTRATLRQKRMEMREMESDVAYRTTEFERQEKLIERGVASRAKFDEAKHELATAAQRRNAIREEIRSILAKLGGDAAQPAERHPAYREAVARRDQAAFDLARSRIYAPAKGILTNMKLQRGEHVRAGAPIFTLVEDANLWIEANLKETELTHVILGQAVTVSVDAYPDFTWRAEVETISPTTGAEFSLLPPENASGNWVKVVQRIPVRLRIADRPASGPALRAGMSVRISIDTQRERSLSTLVQSALAWTGKQD